MPVFIGGLEPLSNSGGVDLGKGGGDPKSSSLTLEGVVGPERVVGTETDC